MPLLSSLAESVPPTINVGWSPAATMGAIQNVLLAVIGGGGLKILANYLLDMKKIAEARVKAVDDRGDAQNVALTARVTELEKALSDERRECDRQLAEMRKELREMQSTLDGVIRQFVTYQQSEARAVPLSPEMRRMLDSLDKVKGKGE